MFRPYISVEETYSDNLDLRDTNKKDDYMTTVRPGILFSNMDAQSGIDFNYSAGIVMYAKEHDRNYVGHNAFLNAKYLDRSHFNFYLTDTFLRSDEPREREYLAPTPYVVQYQDNIYPVYVLSTQTERHVYWRNVVTPRIEYLYDKKSMLGLTFRDNIYHTEDPTGEDSREDYISPSISHWFDARNNLRLEYGFTRGEFDRNPDLTGHMGSIRYTNQFEEKSSAYAEYVFTARRFKAPGINYDIHEPKIGFTYAFDAAWSLLAQIGYFWKEPETGDRRDGQTYRLELIRSDVRTSISAILQGGYTEDYFTSENLGFARYNRMILSVMNRFDRRFSAGLSGSIERADYDSDRRDTIWGTTGTAKYEVLKWLELALEVSHRERRSSIDTNDYVENRGMVKISATYY
jgi:hypothetical protein